LINDLDKTSLQVIKKLGEEIDRARKEKAMKQVLNNNLKEMKRKLGDL